MGKESVDEKEEEEDIVTFFKEFKAYCNTFAPGKPMMLATNSFDILMEWILIRTY